MRTQRQRYLLVCSVLALIFLFLFWLSGGWEAVVTILGFVAVIYGIAKALQWANRGSDG